MLKNLFFALLLLIMTQPLFAQWTLSGTDIYNNNTGNVGIGTTTPGAPLHIEKIFVAAPGIGENITVSQGSSNQDLRALKITATGNTGGGGSIYGLDLVSSGNIQTGVQPIYGINVVTNSGARAYGNSIVGQYGIKSVLTGSSATSSTAKNISNYGVYGEVINTIATGEVSRSYGVYGAASSISSGTAYGGYFTASGGTNSYGVYSAAGNNYFNGNVGIGTTVPDEKLTVYGNIHARGVKVDLNGALADYVFARGYRLRSLKALKAFVDENHHLPEMPSAAQAEIEGLDLGKMNQLLLKKVEELTLYLIIKDKQLSDQELKYQNQQAHMDDLDNELKPIRKAIGMKK